MSLAAKLPGYHVNDQFLSKRDRQELLAFCLQNDDMFSPASVTTKSEKDGKLHGVVRPKIRKSSKAELPKTYEDKYSQLVKDELPKVVKSLGMSLPEHYNLELECVAHGDGCFFARHIDTITSKNSHARLISAVYYFYQEPKPFTGGELRLYSIDGSVYQDIVPANNLIIFFPSIFPHEVLPVAEPSGEFAASRFSINCWVRKDRSK